MTSHPARHCQQPPAKSAGQCTRTRATSAAREPDGVIEFLCFERACPVGYLNPRRCTEFPVPLNERRLFQMTSSQSSPSSTAVASRGESSALVSSQGRTTIADTVVSKIAGIATRDVDGVHAVGGGTARAVGALRERIPGARTNHAQGVSVEVGEKQAAVDLDIVADYGVAIADLAAGIRRHVINSVERMTGLQVTEVNVTVHDVYLDDGSNDDDSDAPARVQ